MFDVITFGSAVIDIFVDTDVSEKKNFISYPVGSKILIKDLKFDIGGGGTNTAVAFARLGLKTGYIGKLGRDENAYEVLRLLKKEHIKFLGTQEGITGHSIILDSKGGERTILTYKGANDNLELKDINLKKVKTKWLYYSSLLEKSFEAQKRLAEILTKKNVKLAFNPSEYLIKEKNLSSLLKITEILILNKDEAKLLTKENDLFLGLQRLGPKIIVITDKDKLIESYDSYSNKKYFLKPHKIKVVERTGAGDAFASGFVAGQIVGKTIPESLGLGLKESESVIRYFGAKNNLLRIRLR
ncbi:MAG: carbohydrate kinase family protein [Nanoarchaeota archaeon]